MSENLKSGENSNEGRKIRDGSVEYENNAHERILESTNKSESNIFELIPVELLEKIFIQSVISSNFTFPGQVCWTYNNALKAIPRFEMFKKVAMGNLP